MMDTASAAKFLGYHKRALLRRVQALGALVTPHVTEGRNGGFLFDDTAIAVFSRLKELERDGLSVAAAAQQIREEMKTRGQNGDTGTVAAMPASDTGELVNELRARIQEQAAMIQFLKGQLETRENEIRALIPGREAGESAPPRKGWQMSRWQHLKAALFGS